MTEALTPSDVARAALEAHAGGPALASAVVVDGPAALLGRRLVLTEDGTVRGTLGDGTPDDTVLEHLRGAFDRDEPGLETVDTADGPCTLYIEAVRPPEDLVIVGAGHIAVPLARLGVTLGFRTTVLDDREEFAANDRFPEKAAVLRTDFSDPFREVEIGVRSYLVLVTRAHKYDFDCLKDLVEAESMPRYIGMIGSRRRVKAAFHALLDAGIPRERLAPIHAPVGLDIGAETPEEIAVSIAAEMIRVRRGGAAADGPGARPAVPLSERERVLDRLLPEQEPSHG